MLKSTNIELLMNIYKKCKYNLENYMHKAFIYLLVSKKRPVCYFPFFMEM